MESRKAMEQLQDAGIKVIPITGRPAGWCDHIARMWPVDGLVGENGAFHFYYHRTQHKMIRRFWRSEEQRVKDRQDLVRVQRLGAGRPLGWLDGVAPAGGRSRRPGDDRLHR